MVEIQHCSCDQCGTCIAVCSANALSIVERLSVDRQRCNGCGRCVAVCPWGALLWGAGAKEAKRGGVVQ